MSERRTLTIGVTINIGNYESLRLEVSDCVQTEGEATELSAFLNRVLDGFANNDATTRSLIDKYRTRVLERDMPDHLSSQVLNIHDACCDKLSECADATISEKQPILDPITIVDSSEIREHVNQEEKPAIAANEPITYTCDVCGAVVSKVQRDISNLFMGKTLCKSCMK
ncbi:MAG TPA: hypothetical protein O0W81_03125 [Methanocorpusculum sp.]|nr:hypothetical protein [Methanocorpusculum sp.]